MVKKAPGKRYMLIDGNALVHRGFHAVPNLTNKAGEPTGAVYGFTMILLRAIKELKPTHIACSFDLAGPTFRHDHYKDYKATRPETDDELVAQFPKVKEVVRALNIPIFEIAGFEADDVLGTLSTKICESNSHNCDVMIVTGDMDTLQLVNNCVKIYTLKKGITDTAIYDEKAIEERFGLKPSQMIDYKALRGDPSDNIKGVKGIGEKGALELLHEFGSIENLYKAIRNGGIANRIKPRVLRLLQEQEESARQSYYLATIVTDLKIDTDIPEYEFRSSDVAATLEIFQELGFKSLVDKLPKTENREHGIENSGEDGESQGKVLVKNIGKQKYELVDTVEKLDKLITQLKKQTELVIDTETTSLSIIDAELVGVSLCFKRGEAYYVPASLVSSSPELKQLLTTGAGKIGHNIKYDYAVLQNSEIELSPLSFDTMVASYLLNSSTRQHGLDALAFNELGYQMQPIEELIGRGKDQITMDQVPEEKVSWYACEDADITLRLKELFAPQLKKEGLEKIFYDIEIPLIEVLASMERAGIAVDVGLLEKLSMQAQKEIQKLEKDIYKLTGEEFNIASPKQLKVVLFERLGLESVGGKKTKTGISTAAGELEKMLGQHPVIEKILQYREITKLQSTYLLALPEMVNKKTGRIHTNYNQTIAATGRLSSVDPNLQNIPIRGDGLGAEVRKAFAAPKGYKLLSIDYSQMELRIAAHLAQDKRMIKIFREDKDIHESTAMEVFGVSAGEVTRDMRRQAKAINFGVLYGLSAFGLSYRIQELGLVDAKDFINQYFLAYPGIKAYIEQVKQEVNEKAFMTNELGRVRKFPEIKSSQYFVRQAAERAAINFPIQSLQADIIKIAMINIYEQIKNQKSKIKMLLQVHDELVFEVLESELEHYTKLIQPLMENAYKLSVPVKVEAKVGDNWGEMKSV